MPLCAEWDGSSSVSYLRKIESVRFTQGAPHKFLFLTRYSNEILIMKMSKSEAGKLGAARSKLAALNKKKQNIETYFASPKRCKKCNSVIGYKNRFNVFCNSSCSASFTNTLRAKKIREINSRFEKRQLVYWNCLSCNKTHSTTVWKVGKYCNNDCQLLYQYNQKIKDWLSNNANIGKGTIKRYLIEQHGYKCAVCGLSDWNNKPMILELEHVDGNSENNALCNLCLICPNCHSQTPTYKGRNKGKGRYSRRVRYNQGKSY